MKNLYFLPGTNQGQLSWQDTSLWCRYQLQWKFEIVGFVTYFLTIKIYYVNKVKMLSICISITIIHSRVRSLTFQDLLRAGWPALCSTCNILTPSLEGFRILITFVLSERYLAQLVKFLPDNQNELLLLFQVWRQRRAVCQNWRVSPNRSSCPANVLNASAMNIRKIFLVCMRGRWMKALSVLYCQCCTEWFEGNRYLR